MMAKRAELDKGELSSKLKKDVQVSESRSFGATMCS